VEQQNRKIPQRMSTALWDLFTGSAPYREVLLRMAHPFFLSRLVWYNMIELWPFRSKKQKRRSDEDE
jgi:hypothetical protein